MKDDKKSKFTQVELDEMNSKYNAPGPLKDVYSNSDGSRRDEYNDDEEDFDAIQAIKDLPWKKIGKWFLIILAVVLVFWGGSKLVKLFAPADTETTTTAVESTTIPETTVADMSKTEYEQEAIRLLVLAGYDREKIRVGVDEVIIAEDPGDPGTGQGSFKFGGSKTPDEVVEFLKSEEEGSQELEDFLVEAGAPIAQLIESPRWVPVQPEGPFTYNGNTGLGEDGVIFDSGQKDAQGKEIFFLFIFDKEDGEKDAVPVRSDCNNPQKEIPAPKPEETTTGDSTSTTVASTTKPSTTLEPKNPSQDPWTQGNAPTGGGPNDDPGPGPYVPPTSMSQPPSETRVNPPPPGSTTKPSTISSTTTRPSTTAPSTTRPTTTRPVTTTAVQVTIEDPTPPPTPEPSAPTPSEPATGYSPPPGMRP